MKPAFFVIGLVLLQMTKIWIEYGKENPYYSYFRIGHWKKYSNNRFIVGRMSGIS